jgi:hypothetical protein
VRVAEEPPEPSSIGLSAGSPCCLLAPLVPRVLLLSLVVLWLVMLCGLVPCHVLHLLIVLHLLVVLLSLIVLLLLNVLLLSVLHITFITLT